MRKNQVRLRDGDEIDLILCVCVCLFTYCEIMYRELTRASSMVNPYLVIRLTTLRHLPYRRVRIQYTRGAVRTWIIYVRVLAMSQISKMSITTIIIVIQRSLIVLIKLSRYRS